MNKKKHRLYVISPSGKQYELGFLSPCKNGLILGTSQLEEVETSHLTILKKGRTISAHITPQNTKHSRTYFAPMSIQEISGKFQSIVRESSVSPLSEKQSSEEVLYITRRMFNMLKGLFDALYEERVSSKEVVHILNLKRAIKRLHGFGKKLQHESPDAFLGLCRAEEILHDRSKIVGITSSGVLMKRFRNKLYGVLFPLITNFDFVPTAEKQEISNPLIEISNVMGIPQYVKEIVNKKFLEKLFS
jgi:hypothetical protein